MPREQEGGRAGRGGRGERVCSDSGGEGGGPGLTPASKLEVICTPSKSFEPTFIITLRPSTDPPPRREARDNLAATGRCCRERSGERAKALAPLGQAAATSALKRAAAAVRRCLNVFAGRGPRAPVVTLMISAGA